MWLGVGGVQNELFCVLVLSVCMCVYVHICTCVWNIRPKRGIFICVVKANESSKSWKVVAHIYKGLGAQKKEAAPWIRQTAEDTRNRGWVKRFQRITTQKAYVLMGKYRKSSLDEVLPSEVKNSKLGRMVKGCLGLCLLPLICNEDELSGIKCKEVPCLVSTGKKDRVRRARNVTLVYTLSVHISSHLALENQKTGLQEKLLYAEQWHASPGYCPRFLWVSANLLAFSLGGMMPLGYISFSYLIASVTITRMLWNSAFLLFSALANHRWVGGIRQRAAYFSPVISWSEFLESLLQDRSYLIPITWCLRAVLLSNQKNGQLLLGFWK